MAPRIDIVGSPVSCPDNLSDDDFSDIETSSAKGATNTAQKANANKSEVNFISGLLYRLFDWMRGKFGDRMTSSQVGQYLDAAFPEGEWTRKALVIADKTQTDGSQAEDTIEQSARTIAYREKPDKEGTMIITDPCHDMPAATPPSQSLQTAHCSVAECLKALCENNQQGKLSVQIPVAQADRFLGGTRGHFALLNASIDNGRVTGAKLVDSKGGLIDTFYDGAAHLMAQFRETTGLLLDSPDRFAIETQYLGDQSVFNDTDCGRFAVAHAETFAGSGGQDYRAIGQDDFLVWCKTIEIQLKLEAPKED